MPATLTLEWTKSCLKPSSFHGCMKRYALLNLFVRIIKVSMVLIDGLYFCSLFQVTSEEKTDTLLWRYLKGPEEVREYKKYRVNGFVFCSQASEENLVTQNSGVTLLASTTFRSSKKDKHPKTQETRWYGMIKQILYLDYGTVHETVFYCNWVKVESGVQMCKDSDYPVVNLKRLKSASEFLDEPVILAEEASQVFYSRDMKNQDWWVPIHPPRGLTAEVDSVEVPSQGSFHDILYEEPHLRELMKYWRKLNNLKNC